MAGSATFTVTPATSDNTIKTLTISFVDGATANTIPAYSSDNVTVSWGSGVQTLTSLLRGHYGLVARVAPGSPAPSAGTLTMIDALGFDFLNGKVTDL